MREDCGCESVDREQRPVVAAVNRTDRPDRRRSCSRPVRCPASVPRVHGGGSNDSINFAFRAISVVYAIFLGFIVSALWSQITSADAEVRLEGAAGVQLASDLTAFDKADSDRIRQSLLEYQRAAVAEWPMAATDLSSPEVDDALRRLNSRDFSRATIPKRPFSPTLSITSPRSARHAQSGYWKPAPTLAHRLQCGRSSSSPAGWSLAS